MTAMPFAPDTLTLHVVSYRPATDDGGVGGFDWSTEAYIDDVARHLDVGCGVFESD